MTVRVKPYDDLSKLGEMSLQTFGLVLNEILDSSDERTFRLTNLMPGNKYGNWLMFKPTSSNDYITLSAVDGATQKIGLNCEVLERTQTTATISVTYDPGDANIIGFAYVNPDCPNFDPKKGAKFKFKTTRLFPDISAIHLATLNIESVADFSDYKLDVNIPTALFTYDVEAQVGPTSISAKASHTPFDDGGLEIEESLTYEVGGKKYTAEDLKFEIVGLKPQTVINAAYTHKISNKRHKELGASGGTKKKTLPELEMQLLTPKCVTQSSAVVAAKTNIADNEVNAGFQWRKYDAPESLPWSEANAVVNDGQIEGFIKNLQSNSYYRLRAFYRTTDGEYYYTEFTTFDPSDFSYFEPTVRTYSATEVTHNSANVKGYILRGSDEIIRQGFHYWIAGQGARNGQRMEAGSEVQTVVATGQVMTATLTNLDPDTDYVVRAFAETESGNTIYGDEMSFHTEVFTGIETVKVDTDDSEAEIVGYYDLSGRRHDSPLKGLNIIMYSNGHVRKMLMR